MAVGEAAPVVAAVVDPTEVVAAEADPSAAAEVVAAATAAAATAADVVVPAVDTEDEAVDHLTVAPLLPVGSKMMAISISLALLPSLTVPIL